MNTNEPLEKPKLIYDGDCGFCRYWVRRWERCSPDQFDTAPSQEVAARFPHIASSQFQNAVALAMPSGDVHFGAEAVFRALALGRKRAMGLWLWDNLPGFRALSEACYRFVAGHRSLFSKITALLWGRSETPPSNRTSAWIFRRGMALVYGVAFLSLLFQIDGLIGPKGILPAHEYLKAATAQLGAKRFFYLPTLFWASTSSGMLTGVCLVGVIASIVLLLGYFTAPLFLLNWFLYLSLLTIGQEFLHFQWDVLLLEAGFLTIFLSSFTKRDRLTTASEPRPAFVWLTRWLLFRLMFSSGVVKLLSGDKTWRNLEALNFHFETQPLPTWIGWYFHQASAAVHRQLTIAMFAVEIAVPFLIFLPRRPRFVSAVLLIVLQIIIALTGNYGFFNLLTIVLCLLLIDDEIWPKRWKKSEASVVAVRPWQHKALAATAAFLIFLSTYTFSSRLLGLRWPRPVNAVAAFVGPLQLSNSYGLFAIMTTVRPEISFEGSNDGSSWFLYHFKYKPGALNEPPSFVAPHQPRLDWQMWFAALSGYEPNGWFAVLGYRLLTGEPCVTALFERNPFPEKPPKYIRVTVSNYQFTTAEERETTGAWWKKGEANMYCPLLWLRDR